MTDLDRQEEALFDAAQQLADPKQRAAFLDAACAGNAELRRRLEGLFSVEPEADAYFDKLPIDVLGARLASGKKGLGPAPSDGRPAELAEDKAMTPAASGSAPDGSGDLIGHYKLLQKVGEGGFGEVWMAEQKEPVRRRVALKIIKLGMDTKQVIARFEAERQALALMDHPNIAKVLDGGATDNGRPYFVMELVRGIRITDYCEQQQLAMTERLGLFIKVCQAIQHAHQKGIIHRDIKPANILVTLHDGVPVPKVIDFGIAKATQQELTDKTVFTQFHQFIGTPAYMSPEQAEMSGLDIDTRSDIYSLGVLLYELLVGQTPFDGKELLASGIDAMRQTIREKEPVRPSTRLTHELARMGQGSARVPRAESGVAPDSLPSHPADRAGSQLNEVFGETPKTARETRALPERLRTLVAALRGDLDWIVMKCLEKDRSRRYETTNGLAMDIERYLKSEPVLARPPSATYRMRKSIRRNRVAFAAAAMVTAALALGAIVATRQAIRATRAEKEQTRQRMMAQQAQANEARERQAAEKARQAEAHLRQRAEARAYAADMTLAQQAVAVNNLGRASELLNSHRPAKAEVSNQLSVISNRVEGFTPLIPDYRSLITDLRGWEWRYLWQYCQNDAQHTLTQRSNSINSLAVSHDRKWLAIGESAEGVLSLWDLQTRREIRRLPAGEGEVAVAFSPREPLLAYSMESRAPSTNRQNAVCLWDEAKQQIVARIPMGDRCYLLAFSEDGQELAVMTRSLTPRLSVWRVQTGTKLIEHSLPRFRATVGTPVALTRNLHFAAQAVGGFGRDGGLRLIDVRTGKERWNVPVGDTYIATIAFSPDGKILAVAEGAGKSAIRLWDVELGREIATLEGHHAYVLGLDFSPDSKTLVSASADQTIRLWDLNARKSVATLHGHKLEVWRVALLSEKGKLLSGCKDGSVLVWDIATTRPEPGPITVPARISAWCFAPDSQSIQTLEPEGVARWKGLNFQQRELLLAVTPAPAPVPARLFSKFSPDGELVAVRHINGVVRVWDLRQRSLLHQIESPGGAVVPWRFLAQGKKLLVAQLERNSLHEWDLGTGQKTRSWRLPSSVGGGAVFPDENWCLTLGFGEESPLSELAGGDPAKLKFGLAANEAMAISPDGKFMATLNQFNSPKLWETATQRELHTFGGVLMGCHSVAFSPDGRRLLAGSVGAEAIRIWDVESRHEVLTLETLNEPVKFVSAAFSPDGNLLGAMNGQGVLYLWRAPSWEEIAATEAKAEAEIRQR